MQTLKIYRTVHTNLYSVKAANMLTGFFKYINTCGQYRFRSHIGGGQIFIEPNGEVVIQQVGYSSKSIWQKKKTDAAVLDHLAWMLKIETQNEIAKVHHTEDNATKIYWNRCNNADAVTCCKSVPTDVVKVNEVYCIYEIFRNRKNFDKRFPKQLIDDIVGIQKDPIQTEMEVARRQEIENIADKYTKLMRNCDLEGYDSRWVKDEDLNEASREARRMLTELKVKWAEKKAELLKQRDEEIATLNMTLNFMVG